MSDENGRMVKPLFFFNKAIFYMYSNWWNVQYDKSNLGHQLGHLDIFTISGENGSMIKILYVLYQVILINLI